MNRDRQPNRNTRKPFQSPVIQDRRTSQDRRITQNKRPNQDRQTIYNERTTSVPRPSRKHRPVTPPLQEPGGKSFFVIGIFIVLILLLLGATGLYAWNLFKSGNNSNQTLSPVNTATTTTGGGVTSTTTPCSDPSKQKNIFVKQIRKNQALEVYIPKGTTSVVALFASRADAWCWASHYTYNQLQGFAIYPNDGQASLVINEEDASKANSRAQGSWALVIVKGSSALVTVVSVAQAHTDAQAWLGTHRIEQANYPLTKVNDPTPA
jgi:hypothetical protein